MELVPAPAITAGIVKTPVPMMLPMTSAVADGSPRAAAAWPPPPAEGGGAFASVGVALGVDGRGHGHFPPGTATRVRALRRGTVHQGAGGRRDQGPGRDAEVPSGGTNGPRRWIHADARCAMTTFHVDSEVGALRRVLLHRPDLELRRLTPSQLRRPALRRRAVGQAGPPGARRLRRHPRRPRASRCSTSADLLAETVKRRRRPRAGCSTGSSPSEDLGRDLAEARPRLLRRGRPRRRSPPISSVASPAPSSPPARLARPARRGPRARRLRAPAAAEPPVHPRHDLLDLRRRVA